MTTSSIPHRHTPRISVNDLARYMVSSPTAQVGIIRRARDAIIPPVTRYRDARKPLCSYLTDRSRSVNPLVSAEQMLLQRAEDPSESSFRQDDAKQTIAVLNAIQGMSNQLGSFDFHHAPNSQSPVVICGVEISVRADLLVYSTVRSKQQIGAAIFRLSQDDAETDAARVKRKKMGQYVATLARIHLDKNITSERIAASRLCMSIDVQHGEVFQAPAAAQLTSNIENACRFIAALWQTA
ncbi:MAG: hypothetical protein HWD60_19820 [Defluviicoccus sp.]|nr:MAG: hypothetical protein HWD60_19820 [Defluviicoccus sp.]